MTTDEARRLVEGFSAWAEGAPGCRALALAGSWARGQARADSDLDLVALVGDLDAWAGDGAWLTGVVEALGFRPSSPMLEVYGVARSWRVMAAAGVELELTLAHPDWASIDPVDPGTRRVVEGGFQALVDKDGLLERLLAYPRRASS